jgi:hypothetical protein
LIILSTRTGYCREMRHFPRLCHYI